MHFIDLFEFFIYMAVMLGIGFFFLKKNKDAEDYFVGGRSMGSIHVGLSVVATDVGGGFSIGLGGLGFVMGIIRFVDAFYGTDRSLGECSTFNPARKQNEKF